ncbi:TIGR04282 family arsenosugar biosynthesis glycosyltransferase [Tenacibaculum sp. AHE15PA]|uniref:TIGR04282 family arsenosugar biosynthesis glycosyltransferase n=1 Tax=Tenacibaculum TaxID=104267 RepID=UPI001C4FC414|nr:MULTISPECIES: TIGR04282 family arsenosugar biosynthesis glycosyltransferase [Tenacibaculum]QXP73305.1 TIGR04282 family arsenosugar biosynthesis glycosyltransferase [Tenacibaculum sp. AHE14PA]QXP77218.1 TIGR04282 family arsenosugar biosynthesis glycosyltransferase [Tenacibaculum sp. AHE15PA]
MTKNLLLIFTRNPELGKAKTRLAKTVGDETALDIYKFLLDKTKEVTTNLPCDKAVYYSVKVRENDIWNNDVFKKHQQEGEDLGIRMLNAFKDGFEAGYEKIMIIGSDLYDLTPNHINDAFSKLDTNDVVIGPAEDGGYYLLGMKNLQSAIFKNKKWGTATVRKDTLKDLHKVSVHLLEELNDVDVFDDIKNHKAFQHFL